MEFSEKITILDNSDKYINSRFNANDTEATLKTFIFKHQIVTDLQKGDTLEIARLPLKARLMGVNLDNGFNKGVKYSIGLSTGSAISICSKCSLKGFSKWIAPILASSGSVYITIDDGVAEAGDFIHGAVMFC